MDWKERMRIQGTAAWLIAADIGMRELLSVQIFRGYERGFF